MKAIALTICACILIGSAFAQSHQQIDPSYLQQYYSQVAQAAGAARAGAGAPIFEQDSLTEQQQHQQYLTQPAQQIRLKDSVSDQVSKCFVSFLIVN